MRIAKAQREGTAPTLDQVHHVLAAMPHATDIERRNRALIAFTLVTGARDGALASFRLKHVDLENGLLFQDAREVRTKNSKSFTTWFFPVGGKALEIVSDWIGHLRHGLYWGEDDPLFPATLVTVGTSHHFEAGGLKRAFWSNASPIRGIFRDGFNTGALPYFKPHSFRRTLAQLGERVCKTPEEFKAWSQNLGHEDVLTTFTSYGAVSSTRQATIIRELGERRHDSPESLPFDERLSRLEQKLSTFVG